MNRQYGGTFVGHSAAAHRLEEQIDLASRSDAKVLITGESGSGKELTARMLHARSARRNGPFIAINCAAVADSLLESELFGHVRGSFTDAYRDRPGLLELAHGGTLMLDEIGEMTMRMQSLLLRFLESGEIQRVGDTRPVLHRDVRVIAATNADLQAAIRSSAFRADLFYRLNVLSIAVPPLRDRHEDVPLLLDHFLEAESARHKMPRRRLAPSAAAAVVEYPWPGNARELRNVAERLVMRNDARDVERDDLPAEVLAPTAAIDAALDAASARRVFADAMFDRMLNNRESFWAVVYDRFMSHDVTREEVVLVVRRGLERTRGSFNALMPLFNLDADDLRAFLSFLRKHQCLMALQSVVPRAAAADGSRAARPAAKMSGAA